MSLPDDYLRTVREDADLEISICGEKILRLWSAEGCIEMNEAYRIQEYMPSSWAVGDDEGGYAVVFAEEDGAVGLYAVSFSDLDDREKVFLAGSLSCFLHEGCGTDAFLSL